MNVKSDFVGKIRQKQIFREKIIYMKCQILLSGKIKKKYHQFVNLSSAEFAYRVLGVKTWSEMFRIVSVYSMIPGGMDI